MRYFWSWVSLWYPRAMSVSSTLDLPLRMSTLYSRSVSGVQSERGEEMDTPPRRLPRAKEKESPHFTPVWHVPPEGKACPRCRSSSPSRHHQVGPKGCHGQVVLKVWAKVSSQQALHKVVQKRGAETWEAALNGWCLHAPKKCRKFPFCQKRRSILAVHCLHVSTGWLDDHGIDGLVVLHPSYRCVEYCPRLALRHPRVRNCHPKPAG